MGCMISLINGFPSFQEGGSLQMAKVELISTVQGVIMRIIVTALCLSLLISCTTRTRDYSFNALKYYDASDSTPVTVDTTGWSVSDRASDKPWQVEQTETVVHTLPEKKQSGCCFINRCSATHNR